MKKKLLAALSLTLACGFAFSTVACSKDKTEKDPPKRDPLDFSTATTNDEIYESLKAGLAASMAHTGGLTMTNTSNRETKTGDTVTYKRSGTSKSSFDPVTYATYETSTSTSKQGAQSEENTYTYSYKNFKQGEKYYSYSYEKEGDEDADESYTQLRDDYTTEFAEDTQEYMDMYSSYFNMFVSADSFDDSKAAYEKVYGDSLTEEKKTNADATASASFAVANNEGTLTATITTAIASKYVHDNYTEEDTTDDVTVTYSVSSTAVLTAKDGKITAFKQTTNTTEKRGETTSVNTNVQEMTIDYAFDTAGYDAITVSLPTDETQIEKNTPYYNVNIVYDGAYFTSSSYHGEGEATATAVVETWNSIAKQTIARNEGRDYSEARDITLYTDAACTKEVSSSATLAELDALEYVFVKTITPKEGCAVVFEKTERKMDLSKEYQIVYSSALADAMSDDDEYPYGYFNYRTIGQNAEQNKYALRREGDDDSSMNVYVDGTATTENDITLEANKLYKVVREYVFKDADFNVFKMYQN